MPILIGWLLTGLRVLFASRMGLWIAGALAWLGVSLGSSKLLIEPAIDQLRAYMTAGMSGGNLGADAIAWAGVLNFDVAVTMIISAYVTRQGVQAGRLFLQKRLGTS